MDEDFWLIDESDEPFEDDPGFETEDEFDSIFDDPDDDDEWLE